MKDFYVKCVNISRLMGSVENLTRKCLESGVYSYRDVHSAGSVETNGCGFCLLVS